MNEPLSIDLETEFSDVAGLLDKTGIEMAQTVLDTLPDMHPIFPAMVKKGILLHGGRPPLARACGYLNITKGCRRVDSWAAGEDLPGANMYGAVAEALAIERQEVDDACVHDRRTRQVARARERALDPSYTLVLRIMAAVYNRFKLDADLTLREALLAACTSFMKESIKFRRCLVLPNGLSVFITGEGRLESYSGASPSGGIQLPLVPQ